MKITDITQELFSSSVYPGDSPPHAGAVMRISGGDTYNLSDLTMSVHNGTHVDAPFHFIDTGDTIEKLPLDAFVGEAVVVRTHAGELNGEEAKALVLGAPQRLLLAGGSYLSAEAAEVVAASGIRLIGTELQSISDADAPARVHKILMSAGVIILEGIVLSGVAVGKYFLCAAPLKLGGLEGAPCRAILISENN